VEHYLNGFEDGTSDLDEINSSSQRHSSFRIGKDSDIDGYDDNAEIRLVPT
jgi:hypothetical protein